MPKVLTRNVMGWYSILMQRKLICVTRLELAKGRTILSVHPICGMNAIFHTFIWHCPTWKFFFLTHPTRFFNLIAKAGTRKQINTKNIHMHEWCQQMLVFGTNYISTPHTIINVYSIPNLVSVNQTMHVASCQTCNLMINASLGSLYLLFAVTITKDTGLHRPIKSVNLSLVSLICGHDLLTYFIIS